MPNEPCGDSVCVDRLDLEYLETCRESYIMANAERNALREQVEHLRFTLAATEKRRDELSTQVTHMASTMKAAAAEIEAHWDAHCDKEGYGPQNLVERLKGENLKLGYACYPGQCASLDKAERERDEEKAGAAQMREALEAVLAGHAGFDECGPIVYLAREQLQAIRDILSTTAGRDFLTRYNEAMGLLREFISEQATCLMATPCLNLQPLADRINAFLKGGERVG